MKLEDILKNMKNPIDDLTVIRKILDLYDYTDNEWFSDKLFDDFNEKDMQIMTNTSSDKMFKMMFKNWRDRISDKIDNLSKEYNDVLTSTAFCITKEEKEKCINRLREINEKLKSLNEIYDYVDKVYKNQYYENKQVIISSLSTIFRNQKYIPLLKEIPFSDSKEEMKKENALYVKMSKDAFNVFSHLLKSKFNDDGIPYLCKCSIDDNGIIRAIIYSSNENLEYTINVVNEIIYNSTFDSEKNQNVVKQQVKDHTYKPPILTSKIGYVGYSVNIEGSISYIKSRTNLIEKAIKDVGKKYLKEDINDTIKLGKKNISLKNYISLKITQYCIEDFERMLKYKNGYTKKDLEDLRFQKRVHDKIRSVIDMCLDSYINGKYEEIPSLNIKINDEVLTIESDMISEGISSILPDLILKDLKRIKEFQSRIKELTPLLGIDKENFANNEINKKRLVDISKEKEKIEETVSSENDFFDDIISHISAFSSKKNIKSPKGEMKIKEYISYYVYPLFNNHLNDKVSYSNGIVVDPYEFIEKNIFGDCQNLYDGNLTIYLKAIGFKFISKDSRFKKSM